MAKTNVQRGGKHEDETSGRRVRARSTEPADWGSVDPNLLAGLVIAVTHQGGAVRFGYTSDGGAYAIGFYGDGDPRTEYIRPNEDVADVIRELTSLWE